MAENGKSNKLAVILALLAVLVSAVFSFGVNQHVAGVSAKLQQIKASQKDIAELAELREQVAELRAKVDGVPEAVVIAEQAAQNAVQNVLLQDIIQRSGMLASTLNGDDAAKLAEAMKLMQQVNVAK